MSTGSRGNRVRELRLRSGWAQAELAERAGISRAAVSAIEGDRLVPSVAAALALAGVFGSTVEELFGGAGAATHQTAWAWPPSAPTWRYWQAEVDGRVLAYPVEWTGNGNPIHDGVGAAAESPRLVGKLAAETLVMATCDPAAGLLAMEYQRQTGLRMLVLARSSREALELLRLRQVHVAGLHYATAEAPQANDQVVRERLGPGFTLVRAADWQEGIAFRSDLAARTVRGLVQSHPRWVGREPGSAARECLDEILATQRSPRLVAKDHRGVAEAIRAGWADAGVCVRLVGEDAGLQFLPVRQESHELCFRQEFTHDRRLQALLRLLQSTAFRDLLGELPGYDPRHTGEVRECRLVGKDEG